MKIGILTFHSEINYGSVLQAFAMQTHLESMGHEAVVIDKYEDARNLRLRGPLGGRSPVFWIKFIIQSLLGGGRYYLLRRCVKTIFFIRRYIHRTPYHFFKWRDAPRKLGVDMITIGSDQVWNPNIVDPADYLALDVPAYVPAIAYSASIGQHEFDFDLIEVYRKGFNRLAAIGVRELEAKEMVESLGAQAHHVVDPTLLVDPQLCWERFLGDEPKDGRRRLFCYFLAEDFTSMLPTLSRFADKNDVDVDFFFDNPPCQNFPQSVREALAIRKEMKAWRSGRVHGHLMAAPDEFIMSIHRATWVLTNSFHGLMFSIIFRKDARCVRSTHPVRKAMSARIEEFNGSMIIGPLVQTSVQAALASLEAGEHIRYDEDVIRHRREDSQAWLEAAISKARQSIEVVR